MVTVHRTGDREEKETSQNQRGRSPVTVTDLVEEVKGPGVSPSLMTARRSPVTVTDLGTGDEITLTKVNAMNVDR